MSCAVSFQLSDDCAVHFQCSVNGFNHTTTGSYRNRLSDSWKLTAHPDGFFAVSVMDFKLSGTYFVCYIYSHSTMTVAQGKSRPNLYPAGWEAIFRHAYNRIWSSKFLIGWVLILWSFNAILIPFVLNGYCPGYIFDGFWPVRKFFIIFNLFIPAFLTVRAHRSLTPRDYSLSLTPLHPRSIQFSRLLAILLSWLYLYLPLLVLEIVLKYPYFDYDYPLHIVFMALIASQLAVLAVSFCLKKHLLFYFIYFTPAILISYFNYESLYSNAHGILIAFQVILMN